MDLEDREESVDHQANRAELAKVDHLDLLDLTAELEALVPLVPVVHKDLRASEDKLVIEVHLGRAASVASPVLAERTA